MTAHVWWRRARPVIVVAAVTLLLGGCLWSHPRFGPEGDGFNRLETTLGPGNVGSLSEAFRAPVGRVAQAVVAGNRLYAAGAVFDATGAAGCVGSPRVCEPLWLTGVPGIGSSPDINTVQSGHSYVLTDVYDDDGVDGCGGVPKTCAPLWTYAPPTSDTASYDPEFETVGGSYVYVSFVVGQAHGGTTTAIAAYDANGVRGCGGTPKVCTVLWRYTPAGFPGAPAPRVTVANGVLYTAGGPLLEAWDADGVDGCGGTPRTCSPLWTSAVFAGSGLPAVSGGFVYGRDGSRLFAFDAAGTTGCTGAPKLCAPLWGTDPSLAIATDPAIANGVLYVAGGTNGTSMFAFDATGATGCSGAPKVCTPRWQVTAGPAFAAPSVANGVVYLVSIGSFGALRAYDVTTHALLLVSTVRDAAGPGAVASGRVYLPTSTGSILAFAPSA